MFDSFPRPIRPSSGRLRALLVAGALFLPFAGAVEAQAHRYGSGWVLGGSVISDLNPGISSQSIQNPNAITPGLSPVVGLFVDRWYGSAGRLGVRYQGAYQRPRVDWVQGDRPVDSFLADISGMLRVVDPGSRAAVLPYLTAGVGAVWYDLGTGRDTFNPNANAFHDGSSRVQPTGILGVGADLLVPWTWDGYPVRLRLEVADHIALESPLRRITDGTRYGSVHHLRFSIGAYSVLDILR